ncbi:AI-2E family transporter [Clostridiaceae bacterium 14S0207]|nr:AI-2E family transporter [Clostridiaceae bacterium 14S0207]
MIIGNEIKKNKFLKYTLIVIWVIFLYLLLKIPFIKVLFKVTLISLFLSYIIKPVYISMIDRGVKKYLAALILVFLLVFFSVVWIIILIPSLLNETNSIGEILNNLFSYINNFLNNIQVMQNNYLFNNIIKKIYGISSKVTENMIFSIMSLGQNILTYLVIPIFIYYFLIDGETFINSILFFFSSKKRKIIKKIAKNIDIVLSKYILSQVVLSFIISILSFFVLIVYGINNALLLSIFNGIFNIIPYFGPILGAIPAIVVAFLTSSHKGIWITVWLMLIQQIEGNLISPKIIGESVDIHPLLVVILLIIGGEISGFMGMILAIPMAVVIKVIIQDIDYYFY